MELSYRDNYEDKYAYVFYCHTRFISNYLSKAIRKDRYETHKDYNAIFIEVGSVHDSFNGGPECLFVFVPFYKEKYERSIENQDVSYYLELFNQGLRKASIIQYQDYDADRNSSIKGYYDSYIEAVKRALVKNDALDNRL